MLEKKINKDQIVSIRVFGEKLMAGYKFYPEEICKIPYLNIILSREPACWGKNGRNSFITYSNDDLENFIVRDSQLFRKPNVTICFSSGWRDDVVMYFSKIEDVHTWIDRNLSGIKFVTVDE